MEMRHSGVHPLLWDQDHPLCSGLCSTISAELKRNSIYWMESSLKEHEALFSWRWSLFQNTRHSKKVTFVSAPAVFLSVWSEATSSNQHDFVRLRHPSPMYPSTKGGAPPSARASLCASLLGVRHLTWCDSLTQNVARELHISFVTFLTITAKQTTPQTHGWLCVRMRDFPKLNGAREAWEEEEWRVKTERSFTWAS